MSAPEPQFLYLTTTGRNSGLPREIEIWFVTVDGRQYVLSEHGRRAQWVKNILSNPRVHVRIGRRDAERIGATARVIDEHDDPRLWELVRRRSTEKYGWGGGLPVEITPDAPRAAGPVSQSS
jgi:deazaflavin-dependent oxidoreductase (nitroreductase family)